MHKEAAVGTTPSNPIQHVGIIVTENHTFDNYFGQRRSNGRPIRSQDDAVGVGALTASSGWRKGLLRVGVIGPSELDGHRNSPSVADQMTFAAGFGTVGGIRSRLPPPKLPESNCRPRRPATNQYPQSSNEKCRRLATDLTTDEAMVASAHRRFSEQIVRKIDSVCSSK